MTVSEASVGRKNNLNFIRLIASLMVLYGHAFFISHGVNHKGLIGRATNEQELMEGLAVDIFFIISGFLITRSYDNKKSLWSYVKARFLRIWPLLFVVTILCAFVLGPLYNIYTGAGLDDYFSIAVLKFLRNGIFYCTYFDLPGVFLNHYNVGVNGSLWTLTYEVICYVLVAVSAPLWQKKKGSMPVLFALLSGVFLCYYYGDFGGVAFLSSTVILRMSRLGLCFLSGSIFYLYGENISFNLRNSIISIVLIILGCLVGGFDICFALGGAYFIFYLAFQKKLVVSWYDKIGDLSYGVYLLAFPVQQLVVEFCGIDINFVRTMSSWWNIVISTIIVLPLAWICWHLIEKPCLSLKDK